MRLWRTLVSHLNSGLRRQLAKLATRNHQRRSIYRHVPSHIVAPDYSDKEAYGSTPQIFATTTTAGEEEMAAFRRTCTLAAETLRFAKSLVRAGVSTKHIDARTHAFILEHGAYPSPLNYPGFKAPFPKSICTSVNAVLAHGIPDERALANGDVINIDVTVYREGFHGDCSDTVLVGGEAAAEADPAAQRLLDATQEALHTAIAGCAPGQPLAIIAHAVANVARARGFQVSSDLTGHGIGEHFHMAPIVCHVPHAHDPAQQQRMEVGMAFTIGECGAHLRAPLFTLCSPFLVALKRTHPRGRRPRVRDVG